MLERVGLATRKDLRRHLRDPGALVLWMLIPLVIGGLISTLAGGSGGSEPKAKVFVADADDSFLSRMLGSALGQTGVIEVEEVAESDARARLLDGEASALLVIPDGFGETVLKEQPCELVLLTNPAQRILPGIVQGTLEVLVDGVFYVHRILGEEIKELVDGPGEGHDTFPDADIARISTAINQVADRLSRSLFPPVIRLETEVVEKDGKKQEDIPVALLFLPGIVLMSLLFAAQGLSEDVWRERQLGTLRRVVGTPLGTSALIGGKVVSGGVVMGASSLLILVLGFLYLSVPLSRLPLALVWSLAAGGLFLALMLWIQVHATSERAGSILTNSLVLPLLMLGGSFFPMEVMPGWMGAVGRWTPNGWALEQLKAILLDRDGPLPLLVAFGILLALGALLVWLCARRVKRRFTGGNA